MRMIIYEIWTLVILIVCSLCSVFNSKKEKITKYSETWSISEDEERYLALLKKICKIFNYRNMWILILLFIPYNIYMIIIKYHKIVTVMAIIYIIAIVSIVVFCALDGCKIIQFFFFIMIVVEVAIFTLLLMVILGYGRELYLKEEFTTETEYSHTIEICDMQEAPYTNVSGNRFYIRTAPSIAYYYKVVTENGNKTTKTIDGSKDYVEENVSNEFKENPHIEVYDSVRKFKNLYGVEKTEVVNQTYIICVPENSIYYER